MEKVYSISKLPSEPAVYVMYGKDKAPAYVGQTGDLKGRIKQHLIRRDSSIATGTSVTGIKPDYVRKIEWWAHKDFKYATRRKAAELVAFEFFDPFLRSRRKKGAKAEKLSGDKEFKDKMRLLFESPAEGCWIKRDALREIDNLEQRVKKLEDSIKKG